MCFSMTASIISGGLLLPIGIASVIQSFKYNRDYLLFAAIPILFSIQQFIEGLVWYLLENQQAMPMHEMSFYYLFFAFLFWPFYFPLTIWKIETHHFRKKLLGILTILGLVLGLAFFIPIAATRIPLTVFKVQHSINYHLSVSDYLITLYGTFYLFITAASAFICSNKAVKLFGYLLIFSFFTALFLFKYTFTSTWCFFVAILSIYVLYVVNRLGQKT